MLHDALLLIAVVATGAFAGAAVYVSVVEHAALG
jgi:hypothetical protein